MSGNSDPVDQVLKSLFDDWAETSKPSQGASTPSGERRAVFDESVQVVVKVKEDSGAEVEIPIPRDPVAFRAMMDQGLQTVEHMLGLEPGQSRWTIPPSYVLSEKEIERELSLEAELVKVKPDQADPILARLPLCARAGEIIHRVSPVPALARLDRLRAVGDELRERGDAVVQKKILQFLVTPMRVFTETPKCAVPELKAFSSLFDDWVDAGMNLLSGPHGHWDRKGRWPSCLLLLQAMSVACGAAAGDKRMIAELPEIDAQLSGENCAFLWRYVRKFHVAMRNLNINDPDANESVGDSFMMLD